MDITSTELQTVTNLAAKQLAAEDAVEKLEKRLKTAKENLNKIQTDLLPNAMMEIGDLGLESFTLGSGESVSLKTGYAASISKKNQQAAFDWLKEHKSDDIIKNSVACSFGRGDEDLVKKIITFLEKMEVPFDRKKSVHHQTLGAFVREQLEKGVDIPHDTFGIFEWQKTIIQR